MPNCSLYEICGLSVEANSEANSCVLHSRDAGKDKQAFAAALIAHRQKNGDRFSHIVFPDKVDFKGATFGNDADFTHAWFTQAAFFNGATFCKGADFFRAVFYKQAIFLNAEFAEEADFYGAVFDGLVSFCRTKFCNGANFEDAWFRGREVEFALSHFQKRRVFFAPRKWPDETVPVFSEVAVNFEQVIIEPPALVTFLEADLRKCQFLDTDVRKVQMTGVIWPKIGSRFGVYDEIAALESRYKRPWARIERLYRELKQNYEDRRDYERAGDFHYGEKEMRRRNPETPFVLRILLTLYWLFSGYGERYLRPLIWAGILLILSTFGYLTLGLRPKDGERILALTNVWDWLMAVRYSLQVMTFLRPEDLVPIGLAKLVNTIESLVGPLLLGLFALAVRQRLKR